MENFPLLGMGTWGMGGTFERDESNDIQSIAALKHGLDLGITLIDTAESYGDGHTEELIGAAIAGYPREKIQIITKVSKTNLRHDDVLMAAKRSLERLGTNYIDLYLIHWPNPEIPLKETMRAMEALIDDRLVRAIGVSNFSAELMEEASKHLTHTRLFANQIEYNLMSRDAETTTLPYAQAHDIRIIASRPFAKGHLARSRYFRMKQLARKLGLMTYRPFLKGSVAKTDNGIIKKLAKKYGKTENQIALNWLIAQRITVIPKATSATHIRENIGALGWKLSDEDIALL